MYGRENRLKVKRDEEKAAIEQAEKDEVHQKASFVLQACEASSSVKYRRRCFKNTFKPAKKQENHCLYCTLLQAESEFRHLLLLKRAQAQTGAMDTTGELPGPEPDAEALQNAQKLRAGMCNSLFLHVSRTCCGPLLQSDED